ncbi:hypothetical protein Ah1_00286 [Aeromonas phage Ah1]|uniref:Uncharacterized protein n=1 Tax=Aeromonas phage Ah1 TaxID=2053701 RepID=A0A2H4YFN2_9CAUD|nr:hypothetical protein KNT77_gp232 [Aeromonas phage Ah1]AUE22804.1 hypothetical protein Ah1_00286 [Aeromonas phage Ah1]UYD60139.1 hypothetical protein OPFAMLBM_00118 [Aeromonas phage avDM12-TAAL]
MYAITYFDDNQRRSVVLQDGRACIFKTKELAKDYQGSILVPKLIELIEKGEFAGKSMFGKLKYKPIALDDARRIKRMLDTMMIESVTKLTFGKTR